MGQSGLDINDLTGFYESFGFVVFKRMGNNNLMLLQENDIAEKKNFGGVIAAKDIPDELFVDTEGRERFVIDDKTSEIDIDLMLEMADRSFYRDENITKKLKLILSKWDGYENYPNLRELNVIFSKRYGNEFGMSLMGYSRFNDSIYINADQILKILTHARLSQYRRLPGTEGEVVRPEQGRSNGFSEHVARLGLSIRGKLFREIQLAIQYREGIRIFSFTDKDILNGLKTKYWKDEMPDEEFKMWVEQKEEQQYLQIHNDFYNNSFSQIEARDVEKRVNLSREDQKSYVPAIRTEWNNPVEFVKKNMDFLEKSYKFQFKKAPNGVYSYRFISSVGGNDIVKVASITPIMGSSGYWNLGFGNKEDQEGGIEFINDQSYKNNTDFDKVLITVFACLTHFLNENTDAKVVFWGNTEHKHLLYKMRISANIEVLKKNLSVHGCFADYEPQKSIQSQEIIIKGKKRIRNAIIKDVDKTKSKITYMEPFDPKKSKEYDLVLISSKDAQI